MMCDQSIRLIASAIEGRVAPGELDTLMAHLGRCPDCRTEAEAQITVKRVLAARPDEALPDGFARRLAARLDEETPRVFRRIDWRTWTVRLLPAAAGLMLVAGVAHRLYRESSFIGGAVDLPSAVASWGHGEVRALQAPVDVHVSDRALLGASLVEATPGAPTLEKQRKEEEVR